MAKRQVGQGELAAIGDYSLRNQKVFNSPFRELKKLVNQLQSISRKPKSAPLHQAASPTPASNGSNSAHSEAEEELFRRAMEGVRPLEGRERARRPMPAPGRVQIVDEDAEVIAELCGLVSGNKPFDVMETEEYVEGRRVDLDVRILQKLKRGEFAVQAHVDLHGMTREEAKEALSEFIKGAVRAGHQSVLVVCGRGLRSPGGQPVLKRAVTYWLSHGSLSAHVLAFVTARPTDGGTGAMYVLLRRQRRRARFKVVSPLI